jgi:hypothetical protein
VSHLPPAVSIDSIFQIESIIINKNVETKSLQVSWQNFATSSLLLHLFSNTVIKFTFAITLLKPDPTDLGADAALICSIYDETPQCVSIVLIIFEYKNMKKKPGRYTGIYILYTGHKLKSIFR